MKEIHLWNHLELILTFQAVGPGFESTLDFNVNTSEGTADEDTMPKGFSTTSKLKVRELFNPLFLELSVGFLKWM